MQKAAISQGQEAKEMSSYYATIARYFLSTAALAGFGAIMPN